MGRCQDVLVKRATYEKRISSHSQEKDGRALCFRMAVWKDLFFAAFILLAVAACAVYFGPFGPTGRPDPTIIIKQAPKNQTTSFLWLYGFAVLLAAFNGDASSPHWPRGSLSRFLFLLPFSFSGLGKKGEKKSWRRRPIAGFVDGFC